MNATFIGYVCGPEYGADEHYAYAATITPELLERVRHLSKKLEELDAIFIGVEDWTSIAVYSRAPVLPGSIVVSVAADSDNDLEDDDPDDPFDAVKHLVYADTPKLTVYRNDKFAWSWYPRWGTSAHRCCTDMFYVKDVEARIVPLVDGLGE
jgi:hypothetical protein